MRTFDSTSKKVMKTRCSSQSWKKKEWTYTSQYPNSPLSSRIKTNEVPTLSRQYLSMIKVSFSTRIRLTSLSVCRFGSSCWSYILSRMWSLSCSRRSSITSWRRMPTLRSSTQLWDKDRQPLWPNRLCKQLGSPSTSQWSKERTWKRKSSKKRHSQTTPSMRPLKSSKRKLFKWRYRLAASRSNFARLMVTWLQSFALFISTTDYSSTLMVCNASIWRHSLSLSSMMRTLMPCPSK